MKFTNRLQVLGRIPVSTASGCTVPEERNAENLYTELDTATKPTERGTDARRGNRNRRLVTRAIYYFCSILRHAASREIRRTTIEKIPRTIHPASRKPWLSGSFGVNLRKIRGRHLLRTFRQGNRRVSWKRSQETGTLLVFLRYERRAVTTALFHRALWSLFSLHDREITRKHFFLAEEFLTATNNGWKR